LTFKAFFRALQKKSFSSVTFFSFLPLNDKRQIEAAKTKKLKTKNQEKIKMKKLVAKFFIALAILGAVPSFGYANTNSPVEAVGYYNRYRLPAYSNHDHRIYLNRGYAQIFISGDGDTDLDLYVYDGNGLAVKAESYGDDEVVNLTIYNSGYFIVRVTNRGKVYNDYSLVVR
jgi:hypothetical protein